MVVGTRTVWLHEQRLPATLQGILSESMALEGLHHVTATTADAAAQRRLPRPRPRAAAGQEDRRNFDQPDVYHLYYGDESGAPGSILTFFEFPDAAPGTAGDGMVHTIVWRAAGPDALGFWPKARRRRHGGHLGAGALPQALYLLSRNVTLHTMNGTFGFELHADQFMKGSGGGNCGLPGNAACKNHVPLYPQVQPFVFGLVWFASFVGLGWWYRRERGTQKLYFLMAWLFTALAVMGKGAPGLVMPLAVALVYPVVSGRFGELRRMQLPMLFVLLLIVALPWYIQMYMRHGYPFFERLILHDMFKRAFVHVHDTNKGDDTSFRYYVWQLGYGLFPWSGFAAIGFA